MISDLSATLSRSQVRELLFPHPQVVFGSLTWGPAHDHAPDVNVLIGDALLGVGDLPIRNERVIAARSDHAENMCPGA
jgi:hypothetical protein